MLSSSFRDTPLTLNASLAVCFKLRYSNTRTSFSCSSKQIITVDRRLRGSSMMVFSRTPSRDGSPLPVWTANDI